MKNQRQVPDSVLEACLKQFQQGYLQIFEDLTPAGREYVREVVSAYLGGDTAMLEALYSVDYDNKRVDPHTFFNHSDYLGHFKEEIYDNWWAPLLEMCDPSKGFFEIILTGSFGIGKTTIGSGLVMAYLVHKVLCLKDPARFFGLAKKSKIVFGIYSLSLESAEDAGFYVLRDQILADSPFFNEVYRRKPFGDDQIIFPKSVVIKTGSRSLHAAGKNLFAICVDEMNLMAQGESTAHKAFKLANSVSRRLESRFMRKGGDIPGACIFLGSTSSESSFLEQRIRSIRGKQGYYIVCGALWDFVDKDAEGNDRYGGERFRVQVGNKDVDSKVLDAVSKTQEGAFKVTPEFEPDVDCQVVEIPVEHFGAFEVDTDGALQDLAGVSTQAVLKLFPSHERIKSCQNKELLNPFRSTVQAAYLGSGLELATEFLKEKACRVMSGRYIPRRRADAPRYIHVDLAKNNDRAGVVMVHPSSHIISIERSDKDEDGLGIYDVHKTVEVDLALAVVAGPKRQSIDFANIRRLIFHLRRCGYWIRRVTYDSYQSEDSIQRLTDAGMSAAVFSVDKEHLAYMILRNAITARRISIPYVGILYDELVELDFDSVSLKVDHPVGGSKDLADALAGAAYQCLTDKIKPVEARQHETFYSKKAAAYNKYLTALQELVEANE